MMLSMMASTEDQKLISLLWGLVFRHYCLLVWWLIIILQTQSLVIACSWFVSFSGLLVGLALQTTKGQKIWQLLRRSRAWKLRKVVLAYSSRNNANNLSCYCDGMLSWEFYCGLQILYCCVAVKAWLTGH